ncbi:MAG: DUF4160 domain-containing protein [Elusimicrobia bacterium]|nr:DUF4160 domain-containing protein [Elusimicrobiota bacterium]
MPKIFEWNGYRFFFFSNEGIPREPCHIHVKKGEHLAKFWVEPMISLASSFDMSGRELRELEGVIEENSTLIRRSWNEYFAQ